MPSAAAIVSGKIASGLGITILPCTACGADKHSEALYRSMFFSDKEPSRVIAIACRGESKQRITATLDLLDRLAPQRQLLTLNRMPAGDPQLASASDHSNRDTTRVAWLKNLLNA